MTGMGFFSRQERFATVGSTNDVVRAWLASGQPEVCLAVADEQTAGRGRGGRSWQAPLGAALLLSLGFRPAWLAPDRAWRLAAVVALAMADAAEEAAGLSEGAIGLKWPNDLVIEGAAPAGATAAGSTAAGSPAREAAAGSPARATAAWSPAGAPAAGSPAGAMAAGSPAVEPRKVGGVLGESDGLGSDDPRVVVGIGVNAGWRAGDFPTDLAGSMTSLHEASGGRPVDLVALLDAFTGRLEARVEALRGGYFDVAGWVGRQVTTGREVRLLLPDGGEETVRALGVDALTGALVVADPGAPDGERQVLSAEVVHARLAIAATV